MGIGAGLGVDLADLRGRGLREIEAVTDAKVRDLECPTVRDPTVGASTRIREVAHGQRDHDRGDPPVPQPAAPAAICWPGLVGIGRLGSADEAAALAGRVRFVVVREAALADPSLSHGATLASAFLPAM